MLALSQTKDVGLGINKMWVN